MQYLKQVATMACALAALIAMAMGASADDDKVTPVFSTALASAAGQTLTVVKVDYPPGGKSAKHHHAGSVFAYVLSGAIRSENSATGPSRVYQAGESFFEPASSEHTISENASQKHPASLLAVFVAPDGAALKTTDQ